MKKRFLITALIICFCGAIVSCKPKEKPEEKSKDNSQVNVKEKKVKENIQEDNSDKKEDKKSEENKERILVLKNKKKIKCGHYFINGIKKEFYTDLYFLIMHQKEKDKNKIFEELIEKILGIIKIKDVNL